jgi:phosphatidylglycerophosphate synthase
VATTWDQYAVRWSGLHGGVDPRRAPLPVRWWSRMAYSLGRLLARIRVPPAAVTIAGGVLSLLVPVAAAAGRPETAAVLVLLATIADGVDGAVAIIADRVTRLGYVYDSVADRLGEAAWLVAFWLLGGPFWLVVVAGAVSWLHEYVRARASAAGMTDVGVVTVAERPTRAIVAILGLAVAGVGAVASHVLVTGTVTLAAATWLLLAAIGLVQLLIAVHAGLAGQAGTPGPGG